MTYTNIIWLASYPRSGNTFLRTILWQCFRLHSASVYPNDLGGNRKLEEYVGHIEHGPDKQIQFTELEIPLVKTHEHAKDSNPAIYILRDGRDAVVSLWQFDQIDDGRYIHGPLSLEAIIEGQHERGTWADHVLSWNPWERPNTLLLKYEDMINDFSKVLNSISAFLNRDIVNRCIPERNSIAKIDGRWVRTEKTWRPRLSGNLLERFNQINNFALKKGGYLSE